MRNLKRSFSLGLASVMLLSTMSFGSSAAYFQDQDKATNQTALEIIGAIGAMSGDQYNNFNPSDVVNRAEMAAICTTMLYGAGFQNDQFVDTNVFTDVPAWASSYVNLAASLGIVNGRGDGIFDPYATVTTAEAMLMILKTIGYFQDSADFSTGGADGWKLDATRQGTNLGLYGDIALPADQPLIRDNVASLLFNALTKTPAVLYNSSFGVYYEKDTAWTEGVNTKLDALGVAVNAHNTLGYTTFQLEANESTDDFGRTTVSWSHGYGKYITDYAIASDIKYVGEVTEKDLYLDVTSKVAEDYNFTVSLNGFESATTNGPTKGAPSDYGDTVQGLQTEVFINDEDEKVNVVGITSVMAEVQAVNDGVVTLNYLSNFARNGSSALEGIEGDAWETTFETTQSFSEGDFVVVQAAQNEVKSVEAVKVVSGFVNEVKENSWVDLNGTQYTQSYVTAGDVVNYKGTVNPTVGTDITLYLDSNDCIVGYASTVATTEYLYVAATEDSLSGINAGVYFTDGTYAEVKISKLYDVDGDNGKTATKHDSGEDTAVLFGAYKFSVVDGAYELTPLANSTADDREDGNGPKLTEGSVMVLAAGGDDYFSISKGTAYVEFKDGDDNTVNSSCVYGSVADADSESSSVQVEVEDEEKVVIVDSETIFVDVENKEVYVGFNSVTTMKVTDANVIFGTGGVADVVYVTAYEGSASGNGSFIVLDNTVITAYANGTTYYKVEGYLDGVKTTLEFARNDDATSINVGVVYEIESENSHGYITDYTKLMGESDWYDATYINGLGATYTKGELILGYGSAPNATTSSSTDENGTDFAGLLASHVDSALIVINGNTYKISDDTVIVTITTRDGDVAAPGGLEIAGVGVGNVNSIRAYDASNSDGNSQNYSLVYVLDGEAGESASVIYVVNPSKDTPDED